MIVREATSAAVTGFLREDNDVAVWWGTWVECAVALSRLVRESRLNKEGEEEMRTLLALLAEDWSEIQPTDEVRLLAGRVSKRHPLKAADTLQIAAALVWCEEETEGREFVCFDDQLRRAASEEGFDVLPESPDEGDGV